MVFKESRTSALVRCHPTVCHSDFTLYSVNVARDIDEQSPDEDDRLAREAFRTPCMFIFSVPCHVNQPSTAPNDEDVEYGSDGFINLDRKSTRPLPLPPY